MEYLIYCDESKDRGPLFSNFYGGALVRSIHLEEVVAILEGYKAISNINGEMKWTKVTENYLEKYIGFMDAFFDLIEQDKVKMRVMFQQNEKSDPRVRHLSKEQRDDSNFMLYYQFFKHAFGLRYSNDLDNPINLKIYFDQFPDKKEKVIVFKDYIYKLQFQKTFLDANLRIKMENIAEVTSHDHVVLQAADIVMGSMYFRLNRLHLEKPPGQRLRGKRTRAKEKLYNHINARIRRIYPYFNIGVNTGQSNPADKWAHPYRHWLFVPNEI